MTLNAEQMPCYAPVVSIGDTNKIQLLDGDADRRFMSWLLNQIHFHPENEITIKIHNRDELDKWDMKRNGRLLRDG